MSKKGLKLNGYIFCYGDKKLKNKKTKNKEFGRIRLSIVARIIPVVAIGLIYYKKKS